VDVEGEGLKALDSRNSDSDPDNDRELVRA
jgi:putative drug exporter of the RND superfamily